MKIITGHQPAYLPWLGLLHKASLADIFIFMDDVQYLEQDWINRNKVKTPQGRSLWLTVPVDLKKSKSLTIKDIVVIENKWQSEHLKSIQSCYGRAKYYKYYKDFFEWLYLDNKWKYLAELNLEILKQAFKWFDIDCKLVIASEYDFKKRKSDLILEHALTFSADVVVTGHFGKDYIVLKNFESNGIKVIYQDYKHPVYEQRFGGFIPNLSFIDLLFNYGSESKRICLEGNLKREDICNLIKR